jgi:hypothetical protein
MARQPKWRFFRDDGTEIDPDLIAKPSLCVSCRKDDDPDEEIPCTLARADQQGEEEFECFAFEPKACGSGAGQLEGTSRAHGWSRHPSLWRRHIQPAGRSAAQPLYR